MTRIHLIRHADVENPRRVIYGHLEGFPLSAKGRAQAAEVGRRLARAGVRAIVHSPLERAAETARIIAAQSSDKVVLSADPELREADFGRYLQGVPYWQVPVRRPLWMVHKARRGLLPGDEAVAQMGGRILAVMYRVVATRPDVPSALVSHADPLMAAWVLLEGRVHSEREIYRKPIEKAGMLEVDLEDGRVTAINYVPPPPVPERPAAEPVSA
jgi:broad specificity phosphatase PhoE